MTQVLSIGSWITEELSVPMELGDGQDPDLCLVSGNLSKGSLLASTKH